MNARKALAAPRAGCKLEQLETTSGKRNSWLQIQSLLRLRLLTMCAPALYKAPGLRHFVYKRVEH